MKILQITPQFPFPDDNGGKISIAETLKSFNKNELDVTLCSISKFEIDKKDLDVAKMYANNVHIFYLDTHNTIKKAIQYLFNPMPVYILKHWSDEFFEILCKLHEKENFDIVHADHTAMATYAIALKQKYGVKIGLRLHNLEYRIWQRYYQNLPIHSPLRYYIYNQFNKLKNYELDAISKFDAAFPIASSDFEIVKSMPYSNIILSNAGVDIEKFRPVANIEKKDNRMALATTYSWIHNVNGAKWFIEKVLPLIRKSIPKAEFEMFGKDLPKDFSNYDGVITTGYVNDIVSHLNKCKIYIAPLFVGSGVRIKIYEALACGLPVVATPVSAEGIPSMNSENGLFVTENEKIFSEIVCKLLTDKIQFSEASSNARQFVEKNFSWDKTLLPIINTYTSMVKN